MGTYPRIEGLVHLNTTIQTLHDGLFHAHARSISCACIDLSSALLQRRPRTASLATMHGPNLTARPGSRYGSEEVPKVDGVVQIRGWLDSPCPLMERIRDRHPFGSAFILARGWLCRHQKEGLCDDGGNCFNERWPGPARLARAHPCKREGVPRPTWVVAFYTDVFLVLRVPKRPANKQPPLASCDEGVRGPSLARPNLGKS
mmetsp:Transcript_8264/g.51482  ORF Transcript_8264/g.51482 Transcript_8264/m.51482 type:complete len:202 (+) Transcript_8264:953-1558(+)